MDENMARQAGCLGLISIVFVIVTIIVGGVFRTEVVYTPALSERYVSEVPFEETMTARHWVFGIIRGKQPDLQTQLAKYLRPGEQITQLTITTRHTFTDNLVATITLLIYCPVTVDVRGKIGRMVTSLLLAPAILREVPALEPSGMRSLSPQYLI